MRIMRRRMLYGTMYLANTLWI